MYQSEEIQPNDFSGIQYESQAWKTEKVKGLKCCGCQAEFIPLLCPVIYSTLSEIISSTYVQLVQKTLLITESELYILQV